jgi:hypothetical protein
MLPHHSPLIIPFLSQKRWMSMKYPLPFCILHYITWHSWYIYIHIYPRDGMFYMFLWLSYHPQTNDLRRWKGIICLFCNSVCFYGVCYRTIIAYQYHVHPTNKYIYIYILNNIYIYIYTRWYNVNNKYIYTIYTR